MEEEQLLTAEEDSFPDLIKSSKDILITIPAPSPTSGMSLHLLRPHPPLLPLLHSQRQPHLYRRPHLLHDPTGSAAAPRTVAKPPSAPPRIAPPTPSSTHNDS
ncbi:hypothetical protein AAC387_Pa03g2936 [Persea americana]